MHDQLLDVKEAAAYLQVSPTTVQRWCRAGRLPAVRIGHEWRIDGDRLRGMVGGPRLEPVAGRHLASLEGGQELTRPP